MVAGFFGLSLLFSDFGPGETPVERGFLVVGFYFFAGLILGFLNPWKWWFAGLVAWGGILIGLFAFFASFGHPKSMLLALGIFLGTPGLSVLGGFIAARFKHRPA